MVHLLVMAVIRSTDLTNIAIIHVKKVHTEFILKILVNISKKKKKKE